MCDERNKSLKCHNAKAPLRNMAAPSHGLPAAWWSMNQFVLPSDILVSFNVVSGVLGNEPRRQSCAAQIVTACQRQVLVWCNGKDENGAVALAAATIQHPRAIAALTADVELLLEDMEDAITIDVWVDVVKRTLRVACKRVSAP